MVVRSTCIILFCIISAASVWSQQKVHVALENVSFEELLSHLEELFEVEFSYAPELFDDRKVSLVSEVDHLDEALLLLGTQHNIEYKNLQEGQILIRPKYNTQELTGQEVKLKIIDGTNNLPLEYVAAAIRGTSKGAYSDKAGLVVLDLDVTDSSGWLDLSLIGYKNRAVPLYQLNDRSEWKLQPDAIDLEEVLVVDRQDILKTDALEQSLEIRNMETAGMTSGLAGNDIFRQVQMLPGLSAHDESSAGLRIRGDEEDQTLIMLDGIPIYNAGHYYGIFSSINSSYVSSMDLYKNNLPIEYGGKTAGMLNINSAGQAALTDLKIRADINLLTASLNAQIPLSDNIALLMSGRSTYGNVSNSPFSDLPQTFTGTQQNIENFNLLTREEILSTLPDFKFNDFNGKLIWKPSERSVFDVNFYNSNDFLSNELVNDFLTRGQRGVQIMNREIYSNDENWSNLGFSINGKALVSENIELEFTGFYAEYDNFESTITGLIRRVGPFVNEIENINDRKNHITDIGLRSGITYSFGSEIKHNLKIGLDLQQHDTDLSVTEQTRQALGIDRSAFELNAFTSYRVLLTSGFALETGLRASYYEGTEETYLSPRLSLSYNTDDNLVLKMSAGRHYQFVRELSFESFRGRTVNFWTLSGGQLNPSASNNLMAGFRWAKDRWSVDVEGWLKEEEEVVEFALLTAPFSGDNITPSNQTNQPGYIPFEGTGRSMGLDLLISHTTATYATWFAYTLSKSTQSFRRILQGRDFPSSQDRRHQLKWVNELKLGDFTLSANMVYSSGRPYTDIALLDPNLNRDELRPEDRVARFPDYARVDLGAQYHFDLGPSKASVGISVYNLLNRQNVKYLQYIFSVPSSTVQNQDRTINTIIGTQSDLLPRTLNLTFSIKL